MSNISYTFTSTKTSNINKQLKHKAMIQVKKIAEQTVEHFDNEGKSLGFLTALESLDLRVQIACEKVIGYYLVFEGNKRLIQPNGTIHYWPNGLYDQSENLLCELFKAQQMV